MKNLRKIASLLLALVMVFALATTAFADDGNATAKTYTITAPNNTHTYEIYQIFTGDYDETSGKLSNIVWGQNGTGTKDTEVSDDVLNALMAATGNDEQKLAVIDDYVNLNGGAYKTVEGGKYVTVEPGYYLIKDISTNVEGETLSRYIVEVVKDVTIAPKADKPESKKKVKDVNDSTGESTGMQDSADYDIGDPVPFEITFTLPTDYETYTAYKVIVHDRQAAGLTFDASSVKVYVNKVADANLINGFTTTYGSNVAATTGCENNDPCTFHIACDNIKNLTYGNGTKLTAGDSIIFSYTATLNEHAVFGATGNPNEMDIEFSNVPYGSGTETTNTPDDKVIVFTYKVDVDKYHKVDGVDTALIGANFTLYKKVAPTVANAKIGADIKTTFASNVKAGALDDATYYVEVGNKTGSEAGSNFGFNGVDDGNYVLVETTVPDGYNAWDAVAFTIEATHDATADNPQLTELKGGNLFEGSVNLNNGTLSADIENKAGTELPTTGGMGTTLFYVFGGILVVAAVVLLVTKKRMSTAE